MTSANNIRMVESLRLKSKVRRWSREYLEDQLRLNPLAGISSDTVEEVYARLNDLKLQGKIKTDLVKILQKQEAICLLSGLCATCDERTLREADTRRDTAGPFFACYDCWRDYKSILDNVFNMAYDEISEYYKEARKKLETTNVQA